MTIPSGSFPRAQAGQRVGDGDQQTGKLVYVANDKGLTYDPTSDPTSGSTSAPTQDTPIIPGPANLVFPVMFAVGSIGTAVDHLMAGGRVRRAGWNGKGMYLEYVPETTDPATFRRLLPYVRMFTAQGDLVPWLCSQTDLLAHDWESV